MAFLGDEDMAVRIRRAEKQPTIWGPRPPITYGGHMPGRDSVDPIPPSGGGAASQGHGPSCRGLHCKCMNLDGLCLGPHNGDHDCQYA